MCKQLVLLGLHISISILVVAAIGYISLVNVYRDNQLSRADATAASALNDLEACQKAMAEMQRQSKAK